MALGAALVVFPFHQAAAHPLGTSSLALSVGDTKVVANIQLPLDKLSEALAYRYTASNVLRSENLALLHRYVQKHLTASDSTGSPWTTVVDGGSVVKLNGAATLTLDATLVPESGKVGDFVLHYDALVERLPDHQVFAAYRYGDVGKFTSLETLNWQHTDLSIGAREQKHDARLGSLVKLGMAHIAEGYDHLLFLAMLLIPVPLRARQQGYRGLPGIGATARRVVFVATAFTLGHSITLALVSFGVLHVPVRPIETLVALSIAVAAVHAVRPLVAGGEAVIAAGFGLVHGGAFATTILEMDLSKPETLTAVFGFNIGIELAQLVAIAVLVPVLYVASANRNYRILVAVLAAASILASADWIQAIWRGTDPHVDAWFGLMSHHPLLSWLVLAVVAGGLWALRSRGDEPIPAAEQQNEDLIGASSSG